MKTIIAGILAGIMIAIGIAIYVSNGDYEAVTTTRISHNGYTDVYVNGVLQEND